MKHLFIINPVAYQAKGQINVIIRQLEDFFESYPDIRWDYHITRWSRDAVGYVRRYLSAEDGLVRVHAVGGTGTLYEVVNGVFGLPNAQVSSYPLGLTNRFVAYFGEEKKHLFKSIRNLVFADTAPIDLIKCGNRYAASTIAIGDIANSTRKGLQMYRQTHLPVDLCLNCTRITSELNEKSGKSRQEFDVQIEDSEEIFSYTSLIIANIPTAVYSGVQAPNAKPNDGLMDYYFSRTDYTGLFAKNNGLTEKVSDVCKKVVISSDSPIRVYADGEFFYESRIEFEIVEYAIDFVCPMGIDIDFMENMHEETTREKVEASE